MDLSVERWEGITPVERVTLAKRLAKQLPSGFTFVAVRTFRLGEVQHHVALFQKDDATFSLIPGAEVSIGYDAARPWQPNPDELESWQGTPEEPGLPMTIPEYLGSSGGRMRGA